MTNTATVTDYLETEINSFLRDPPDSLIQRGYLAALIETYRVAAGLDIADFPDWLREAHAFITAPEAA